MTLCIMTLFNNHGIERRDTYENDELGCVWVEGDTRPRPHMLPELTMGRLVQATGYTNISQ